MQDNRMPRAPYARCHQPHVKEAVDRIERRQGLEMMRNDAVIDMMRIVEKFIRDRRLICYGGTAINNILPRSMQFYDTTVELPDYDFFSPNPVKDAKDLANIYAHKGYSDVVASAGVHGGTFKVHVNYVPVADITYLDPRLYSALKDHTVVRDGIHYTPPVYLKMLMHLELSRPDGDVSRWDKVANRLALLDEAYPMREPGCTKRVREQLIRDREVYISRFPGILGMLRDFLARHRVVFAGAFAVDEINYKLRRRQEPEVVPMTTIVAISTEAKEVARDTKRMLESERHIVKMEEHEEVGEVIGKHWSLHIDDRVVAVIFEALECHAMNPILINDREYRIATIDTLLTLYLPFIFVRTTLFTRDQIICLCNDLSSLAQECGIDARGPLARFDRPCYGNQTTLADIRRKKSQRFKRLQGKQDKKSREEWTYYFLRYEPGANRQAKAAMEKKAQGDAPEPGEPRLETPAARTGKGRQSTRRRGRSTRRRSHKKRRHTTRRK